MQDYLLNALVTLFVAVDPIGLAPIFAAVTAGRPAATRRRIAIKASAIAAFILGGSTLVGAWLLEMLGISLAAFRIAGGLLLFLIALEMLFDLRNNRRAAAATENEGEGEAEETHDGVAAFPLAIPLIAGPAAISACILIASQAPSALGTVGLISIVIVVVGVCLAVFLLAGRIESFLGPSGRVVLTRLLGLILAALSVQFVADGIRQLATG